MANEHAAISNAAAYLTVFLLCARRLGLHGGSPSSVPARTCVRILQAHSSNEPRSCGVDDEGVRNASRQCDERASAPGTLMAANDCLSSQTRDSRHQKDIANSSIRCSREDGRRLEPPTAT